MIFDLQTAENLKTKSYFEVMQRLIIFNLLFWNHLNLVKIWLGYFWNLYLYLYDFLLRGVYFNLNKYNN